MKVILFLVSLFSIINAQTVPFNEKSFFTNLKTDYYILNNTGVNNFTALVSNIPSQRFSLEKWKTKDIFPLQIIWIKPNKLYISQLGVKKLNAADEKDYTGIVNDIKKQLKGLLYDFKRFYVNGLYESISDTYQLSSQKDFVIVNEMAAATRDTVYTQYVFGKNGLCLRIENYIPRLKQKVITIPNFEIIKTKWLCKGWTVQILKNDQIKSGFTVEMNMKFYKNIWLPESITINVQKVEEKGKTFVDQLLFRNYLFNQSIKLVNQ